MLALHISATNILQEVANSIPCNCTGHNPPLVLLHKMPTCLIAIGSATPATSAALVAFSHAALFSPALSTLATALTKGFLT
jgi:hypothetical protein